MQSLKAQYCNRLDALFFVWQKFACFLCFLLYKWNCCLSVAMATDLCIV